MFSHDFKFSIFTGCLFFHPANVIAQMLPLREDLLELLPLLPSAQSNLRTQVRVAE